MSPAQRQRVDRAIALGVDFLRRSQLPHGELRCWVSNDPTFRTARQFDSSVFAAAQVGHSLRWVPAHGAQEVVRGVEASRFQTMFPRCWGIAIPQADSTPGLSRVPAISDGRSRGPHWRGSFGIGVG